MNEGLPELLLVVPTYLRPTSLRELLPLLEAQASSVQQAKVTIAVIDNDPAESGRAVVARHPRVRYLPEPQPGLASVRNRALDAAAAYQLLVFIDDDEVPSPHWLTMLLDRWVSVGSTAVAGPAVPDFPPGTDPWVLGCGVLELPTFPDGATLPSAATNNLLLDMEQVRALNLRFDERYGLTGGEDTMFCRTLVQRGGTITWCADAAVRDPVPASRARRRWMLRRAYRAGTTWSRILIEISGRPGWLTRLELVGRGCVRVVRSAVEAGLAGGPLAAHGAKATCAMASGFGMVAGAAGHRDTEYKRSDNS